MPDKKDNRKPAKRITESEAISVEDAISIAETEDDAALKKLKIEMPDDQRTVRKKDETYVVQPGVKKKPQDLGVEDPAKSQMRKHTVKSDFSSADRVSEVTSPSEDYADVTAQVLALQKLQTEAQAPAETAQMRRERRKAEKAEKKAAQKPLPDLTQALGDYRTEGAVTDAVAQNEAYLRERNARRRKIKLFAVIMLFIFLAFLLTFGISAIVNKINGFTVNLTGENAVKGLTLFATDDLSDGTTRLEAGLVPECDNLTYGDLTDVFRALDAGIGNQSKEANYFAYSFYVGNMGKGIADYTMELKMLSASKGVDDAIRVVLIEDTVGYGMTGNRRQRTVYAKPEADPVTGEWLTDGQGAYKMQKLYSPQGTLYPDDKQDNAVPFHSQAVPVRREVTGFGFAEGQNLRKYTVMIYLEGGDADCVSAIKGGGIKMRIDFSVSAYRVQI